jgi:hypothetical protein
LLKQIHLRGDAVAEFSVGGDFFVVVNQTHITSL